MNEWIFNFCTPDGIHIDQGRNFQSVEQLYSLFGINITIIRTRYYHRLGNRQCERVNRIIINLLRTLRKYEKSKLPSYLPKFLHAHNSITY